MTRSVASLGLAHVALLFAIVTACSSTTTRAPTPAAGGDADSAGAPSEPGAAGGNGGDGAATIADAGSGGSEPSGAGGDTLSAGAGGMGEPLQIPDDPAYGASVESFTPGAGAGYNQDKLPGIVLGPPRGKGSDSGSLDVVSLGAGGEIVLAFGERDIVDGPGPDLLVFENAFWPGGDPTQVFYELGEVSVSEDGQTWKTFACDPDGDGDGSFPGCAGWTPTLEYDAATLVPLDPARSGGDAFDLADVGLKKARFVKIHDLETLPAGGMTTGFDLDAVAAIHAL